MRDFWNVDADTVVFVADPSLGNILNFNIGANIDLQIPPVRLTTHAPCCGHSHRGKQASKVVQPCWLREVLGFGWGCHWRASVGIISGCADPYAVMTLALASTLSHDTQ